jgi:hypothetical protein
MLIQWVVILDVTPRLKQIFVSLTLRIILTPKFLYARCARHQDARFELLSMLMHCFRAKLFEKMFRLEKPVPAKNFLGF